MVVALVVIETACRFQPGSLSDANTSAEDSQDVALTDDDAASDGAIAVCANPTIWRALFDVDPTGLDINGDGTEDWAMRDLGTLAGSIASGIWSEPGSPIRPLDTQPKQDFATRTVVDVRMRNTVRASTYGAVMWINVDYAASTFAPLYLVVQLQTSGLAQDVTLFGKTSPPVSVPLYQTSVASADFIDIRLDIEPALDHVTITVGGETTMHTYSTIDRASNDDRWATLLAWNGDSEFDSMRVAVCP
jgi:hypothetical protein